MNVTSYVQVSKAGQAKDGYCLLFQREESEVDCPRIHVKRRSFYGGLY
ncbi:hypothetical protein SAMN04487970_102265 [Paenibacillus tianmuensis]|uniref:Uncharacterized protein n=1 Tax=Paenibacillus tianmuensis TaxID=624147 RepID=A0A1G4S3I8_9BACL|nr:hypothetical protein SAMN04487970_102265 [Paenibacillus tianmuensis]